MTFLYHFDFEQWQTVFFLDVAHVLAASAKEKKNNTLIKQLLNHES